MSATDQHPSSLGGIRKGHSLIGLSTIDIPESSHGSSQHSLAHFADSGGPFNSSGAVPLAGESTTAALSIGGSSSTHGSTMLYSGSNNHSSHHSSSLNNHHHSHHHHHPHHQFVSSSFSNGGSIGQWSPVKHSSSMSPYHGTVPAFDYSITIKGDRDSPAISGSSNTSSSSSSTTTVSSIPGMSHGMVGPSLYSGMPHSAPTLLGVSDDYATAVPRTGSAVFGTAPATDSRVFGHALDFPSSGGSAASSSDESPTEVKISAPTPLSSFPQLPRFHIHSIPPFKPPSSSFKTEASPSNVDVKIPIIDPNSVSVSTQSSSASVGSAGAFVTSLPYGSTIQCSSVDRYPLTKRRKFENNEHSHHHPHHQHHHHPHLTGLSTSSGGSTTSSNSSIGGGTGTAVSMQYSYSSAPVASLQPLMTTPAVTLAGRPSYSATISFPSFRAGGALVPPGLAGHSNGGMYGGSSTPAGMIGDVSMPPDVMDHHYTESVRSSPRKRKPRRKSGASARSMDRDELVFVRFLFEDTEGLRNTDDLSAGDATAGPNAKGFQRGGRRTTKTNAVTVTHFGTKPPAEHPAYSRIRVWKDERGRQFYDCVCNARKPVQDLNKIKKHALSHDQGRFMCDICGKVFGKNHLQLNAHKKTHKAKRNRSAMDSTSMPNTAALIHGVPPAPVLPPPAIGGGGGLDSHSQSTTVLSHLSAALVAPPPPPMMP